MKGNQKIIDKLNVLLKEELTAINQYFVHAEMCDNWGYEKLHKHIEKRSVEEMKHAEKLIKRILYLDGKPVVSELNKISIGSSIDEQFRKDLQAEIDAVEMYNDAIKLSTDLLDGGTKELLDSIILEEENHADWLEAQLSQIEQMGVQNYLAGQIAQ